MDHLGFVRRYQCGGHPCVISAFGSAEHFRLRSFSDRISTERYAFRCGMRILPYRWTLLRHTAHVRRVSRRFDRRRQARCSSADVQRLRIVPLGRRLGQDAAGSPGNEKARALRATMAPTRRASPHHTSRQPHRAKSCHINTVTFATARFDHTGITSGCASCHNGSKAIGKPNNHIATSAPCETCHRSTASFTGANFTHSGITAGCASCHNGTSATGKPAGHIVTTAPCESCHKSTSTFSGASFAHTGITSGCASCHNGKTAMGKPSGHIATSAPCETCHRSTSTFSGASFAHTGITSGCASCHNGPTATGKPAGHVATSAACETCHKSTSTFSGASFSHTGITSGCASCHNG